MRDGYRALLVSHVFPPQVAGGAARMGQFARLLPELGWEVTVLTAEHGNGGIDQRAQDAIYARAHVVRTKSPALQFIKRGSAVPRHGSSALFRGLLRTAATSVLFPDREVLWMPGAIRRGREVLAATRHDVVLASHGPASNLLVGTVLAREHHLPLVVDFRDLWSTLPMRVFATPLHRRAARTIEHYIVHKASRILAVAPAMAEAIASEHGLPTTRAATVCNGFDPDDIALVRDERPPSPRPFRLMYTGTVHAHYNLDPLWKALRSLAERNVVSPETLQLEFVGNLAIDDVRRYALEAFVTIRPYVPHHQVFDALATADALLVVETPGYYAQYGYAAKVFDYVLTGKPIIGLVEAEGNTATLLRSMGVGYCVEPSDVSALERVLVDVLAFHGAAPRRVDADAPPLRDFNRRHLVEKLADVLRDVVESEPRGRW